MKLHIGCKGEAIPGFKRLDIVQHGDVDFVRDAKDLTCFKDGEVEEIYASHILEHFPKTETDKVLTEWARGLKPGGIIHIAVPDFDAIVAIYLKSGRMMTTWLDHLIHGDQLTPFDFHYHCFTYQTFSHYLSKAGFGRIEKLKYMPYGLKDASGITDSWFNIPISLNIKAVK